MIRLLKRKWWVTLIQGILLVIFSFYIFTNPLAVLGTLSMWIGMVVLLSGAIGIIGWLLTSREERENLPLIWSLATTIMGGLMLMNTFAMMKALTIIFGCWMLMAGLAIFSSGWNVRKSHSLGWGAVVAGLLAGLGGLGMIFNIKSGAIGISSLLGISVLLSGIAIILLALIKKTVVNAVRGAVNEVNSN
jgi:uncharacterized membrane protein HdeD (DUF308 family)